MGCLDKWKEGSGENTLDLARVHITDHDSLQLHIYTLKMMRFVSI